MCDPTALSIPGPANPLDPAEYLPNYPVVVVDAESSARHAFSVVAGQAAPGVTTVVAQYPDGSEITMRPSDARVFVAVLKPQKSHRPSAVIASWPGGKEACSFDSESTSYTCRRPRSETTGVPTVPLRDSRFGPVSGGCSPTGCTSSAAQFTRCSTGLRDYLLRGGPTPGNVNDALARAPRPAPTREGVDVVVLRLPRGAHQVTAGPKSQ